MKRVTYLLLLFVLLFIPSYVHADDSWLIENFNSNIAIRQSGVVRIVETISVDFRDNPKHGIYRDIPYAYEANGNKTYTNVDITQVLQNNKPAKYIVSETNGYEEVKIGDPNQTITGRNVYTIMYTVTGVLRGFSDHDELYWNATGNDWQVAIQRAEATVTFSSARMTRVTCYEGPSGSQMPCQSNIAAPQVATFATTSSLAESEGLTVVVGYKKGLVPLLVGHPPKSFLEKLFELPTGAPFYLLGLLGIGTLGFMWYRYGRDYWFGGNLFGSLQEKGTVKPIGAHETISVEFTPPEDLRPAEIGVLMDERADTRDVTSSIIDLATRGYLKITEIPKKWMFGKVDYLLTKTTAQKRIKTQSLLAYEQLLLDKLFYKRSQVKTSSLKTTFYQDLALVKQALYDDVVAKKLFPFDPEKTRSTYRLVAVFLGILGIVLLIINTNDELAITGVGLIVDAIFVFIMNRVMPHRTAYGHELYRRCKGYFLFIDSAEKYRQQYFEKENMFNEVLPYAIVFGLTKKFAKQMDTMGLRPEQTDWYVGLHPFATGVFVSNVNDFSNSFSSAIASTPSSTGGFSGGSSGGGFGGGGGGSW